MTFTRQRLGLKHLTGAASLRRRVPACGCFLPDHDIAQRQSNSL